MAKIKKSDGSNVLDQRKQRERRIGDERRTATSAVVVERRAKVNRRRQIDPTTCERDYTDAEIEFMHALDQYKRANGRMFPTCSEILEVIRGLGYEKSDATPAKAHSEHEQCCAQVC